MGQENALASFGRVEQADRSDVEFAAGEGVQQAAQHVT